MPSIINATSASVITTADNSGSLALQANGITALTINDSSVSFANTVNFQSINLTGTSSAQALKLRNATESITTNSMSIGANTNFFVSNGSVQYWTANNSSNTTLNITFSSGTSLNTMMANNDSLSVVALLTNGATGFYPTTYQIDGIGVTPRWQANSAPTIGNANSVDVYGLTIIKTNANTYTVLASQTQFR